MKQDNTIGATISELLMIDAKVNEVILPSSLQTIKERFQKALDDHTEVLIELNDISNACSVKVAVTSVYDRWCLCHERRLYHDEWVEVPYTVHYTDLIKPEKGSRLAKIPKIVFKGEKAFA
jgi:hypothetical protein